MRTQLKGIAVRTFESMSSWDHPDELAVPMARISTRAQVMQAGMLQSMVGLMNGDADRPDLDVTAVTGDAIRDGDIAAAWRIPIYALWSSMASGDVSQPDLEEQGRNDVTDQAVTDLALSQRETMRQIGQNTDGVVGYWRVPDGGSSCEFCVLISDQMYHSEDLMPVHPGCECSVEPAFASDEGDQGDDE